MGLFDFFKKKKNAGESGQNLPEFLTLTDVPRKEHTLAYGALLGFENAQNAIGETAMNALIEEALQNTPIEENPVYKICQAGTNRLMVRVIYIISSLGGKNYVGGFFPYFTTSRRLPVEPRRILRWNGTAEAEIEGVGRDTFAVSFYSTDFASNESVYGTGRLLSIELSALALVIDESTATGTERAPLVPEFAGFLPSSQAGEKCFYDFIGTLLQYEEHTLNETISGYILTLQLVNNPEDADFFTVDAFVNRQNMRIETLRTGMKLTGCLWFQGGIVW